MFTDTRGAPATVVSKVSGTVDVLRDHKDSQALIATRDSQSLMSTRSLGGSLLVVAVDLGLALG